MLAVFGCSTNDQVAYIAASGAVWNSAAFHPRRASVAIPTMTAIETPTPDDISASAPKASPNPSRRSRGPSWSESTSCARPKVSDPVKPIWKAQMMSCSPGPNRMKDEAAAGRDPGPDPGAPHDHSQQRTGGEVQGEHACLVRHVAAHSEHRPQHAVGEYRNSGPVRVVGPKQVVERVGLT